MSVAIALVIFGEEAKANDTAWLSASYPTLFTLIA
jgi:hypothetical protein